MSNININDDFNNDNSVNNTDSLEYPQNFVEDEFSSDVDVFSDDNSLSNFTDNNIPSFVRLSEKYKDITSSALTMLIVGCAGILFMIMVLMNIIPLPLNPSTSWLFYSVMGGIFIIFIIAGCISFMHAKQVKIDADIEDKLIEDILSWSKDNITKDILDEGLDLSQPEEILYFGRADKIKNILMHQFESADEGLLYEYAEQIYHNIYEK